MVTDETRLRARIQGEMEKRGMGRKGRIQREGRKGGNTGKKGGVEEVRKEGWRKRGMR